VSETMMTTERRDKALPERSRVFLRGRTYWIAYCCRLDGKVREVRESAHTESEAAAWEHLADRVRQVRTPELDFDPRAERLSFDDIAEGLLRDYRVNRRRSLGHAERAVRRLRATFGGLRAVDIDTDGSRDTRTIGCGTTPHQQASTASWLHSNGCTLSRFGRGRVFASAVHSNARGGERPRRLP
jgi:hypothetical protein